MEKNIKAFFAPVVLFILGTAVTLVFGLAIFPNWESHQDFSMSFPKGSTLESSDYYACESDELIVVQTEGSSSAIYDIYMKKRGSTSTTTVATDLQFANNNEWNGEAYSLSSSWWSDIKFSVTKSGTQKASELGLSLGRTTD